MHIDLLRADYFYHSFSQNPFQPALKKEKICNSAIPNNMLLFFVCKLLIYFDIFLVDRLIIPYRSTTYKGPIQFFINNRQNLLDSVQQIRGS